jgi:hypothetical protein
MRLSKLKGLSIIHERSGVGRAFWEEVVNGFYDIFIKASEKWHDSAHFNLVGGL